MTLHASLFRVHTHPSVGAATAPDRPRALLVAKALHYLTKAAEQDDPKAMSHLGHMYANGQGVEPSNETALMWFNKVLLPPLPSMHKVPRLACTGILVSLVWSLIDQHNNT